MPATVPLPRPAGSPPPVISWYRCAVPKDLMKTLNERSDACGWWLAGGHLALMLATGLAVVLTAPHVAWPVTALLLLLHGTVWAFCINGVHELGHGTVFRTRALNNVFLRIFSFLGLINPDVFNQSHIRHHRFTLHPPDDLEVVLPRRVWLAQYLRGAFVDPVHLVKNLRYHWRIATDRFDVPWENAVCPPGSAERRDAVRWARILLGGHALIVLTGPVLGWWWLPVLVTLGPYYGAWLFLLCNETQHIGLAENQPDFRLSCRTFTTNPLVEFLYWHMNYHIEHHMFAAVPCYHLGRLHRAIRHDLPPCPHGLAATWREIAAIVKRQEADPTYFHLPPLPGGPSAAS
jgi:fatty acid desaturase